MLQYVLYCCTWQKLIHINYYTQSSIHHDVAILVPHNDVIYYILLLHWCKTIQQSIFFKTMSRSHMSKNLYFIRIVLLLCQMTFVTEENENDLKIKWLKGICGHKWWNFLDYSLTFYHLHRLHSTEWYGWVGLKGEVRAVLSAVQENKTLCQYTALGGHRLEFFGSAWSEMMDIWWTSIWMIPTQP